MLQGGGRTPLNSFYNVPSSDFYNLHSNKGKKRYDFQTNESHMVTPGLPMTHINTSHKTQYRNYNVPEF